MAYNKNFKKVIDKHIDIAKDLCYNEHVIELIKAAQTEDEIAAIMLNARKELV